MGKKKGSGLEESLQHMQCNNFGNRSRIYRDCGLARGGGFARDVGAVAGGELCLEVLWGHRGLDDYALWEE